jgi:membrane complex biogenesis BtpA family protein
METEDVFGVRRPIVGMVHLPPLPGAPRFDGDRDRLHTVARRDAAALAEGGVDAVMLENFGDAPFYPTEVPRHTVAEMTALAETVKDATNGLPLGVNVLRNDAESALSVAAAVDGDFVRVNVHTGARVADQGILQGRAHETMRLRERLDTDVAVLADVDVKHSAPLADAAYDAESLAENAERGLADGVVISGARTGRPTDLDDIEDAVDRRDELGTETPVFVGSGVTKESVGEILGIADGAIVGTAFKADGETENPVDPDRVAAVMAAAR